MENKIEWYLVKKMFLYNNKFEEIDQFITKDITKFKRKPSGFGFGGGYSFIDDNEMNIYILTIAKDISNIH